MDNILGEYVKKYRTEQGMSLREFAHLCGVSHTHIDSIEKGYDVRTGRRINLTGRTVKKLSQAIGVPESEIINMSLGIANGQQPPSDEELKFALFGNEGVSDEMLDEVRRFAQFIKSREDTGS